MRKNEQERANKILSDSIYIIIVCIIFAILLYIILNNIIFPYKQDESLIVNYDLTKDLIPEPEQNRLKDTEEIVVGHYGIKFTIEKLAEYDITGKVEAIKDYSTSAFVIDTTGRKALNLMSPRDITLSWGEIALKENNGHIYCDQYEGGYRYVMIKWDSWLEKKFTRSKILSSVSNNHVITLDKNAKKALMKVKEGQIMRIIGHLVYVEGSDGTTWGPSSMSRTDSGMHSCEIVLADKIIIMP